MNTTTTNQNKKSSPKADVLAIRPHALLYKYAGNSGTLYAILDGDNEIITDEPSPLAAWKSARRHLINTTPRSEVKDLIAANPALITRISADVPDAKVQRHVKLQWCGGFVRVYDTATGRDIGSLPVDLDFKLLYARQRQVGWTIENLTSKGLVVL